MVDSMRWRKALGAVVALLAVVALWNPLATALGARTSVSASSAPTFSGSALVEDLVHGEARADSEGFWAGGAAIAQVGRKPPSWFADEVLDLLDKNDVMANDDWSVVGFQVPERAELVLEDLVAELESRGWAVVQSGAEGVVSGVKEEGVCQWLWLGCAALGEETSVVVQVAAAS